MSSSSLTEKLTRPLKVAQKIMETPEACTLVLEIPPENRSEFNYKPGQFVTFFMDIDGEEIKRSYSLSTTPLVDSEFKVTIKRVPKGKGSTFLVDRIKEGETLKTTPPQGQFFKMPADLQPRHYFLYAGGSGITPIFSILKTVISMNPQNQVTLLYCNRGEDNIIYRQELEDWKSKHGDRFTLVHQLSQPSSAWAGAQGRVDERILTQLISEARGKNLSGPSGQLPEEHYLCGPTSFMELIREQLTQIHKVKPELIHIESFGLPMPPASASATPSSQVEDEVEDEDLTYIGQPKVPGEQPQVIVALLNGETCEVTANPDESILETLINAGFNPPYSCMEGACMACMAKVIEGRVVQDDPGILTEENISACEALTCQARPLSRRVQVDYDNL